MVHLGSLDFCNRILPGLFDVFGLVLNERCPIVTVAHLGILKVLFLTPLDLLLACLDRELLDQLTLVLIIHEDL